MSLDHAAEPGAPEPRVDGRTTRYGPLRARLLQGATAYVLEHGLSSLSLRPLAAALGVSHAALRNHFGTKERLIVEVLEELRKQAIAISADREARAGESQGFDPYERWYAQWTQETFVPGIRLIFEAFALAFQHPERYEAFLSHAVDDWLEIVRPFLRSIGCPAEEIDEYATTMTGMMYGLQLDLIVTRDRARIDRAFGRYLAMLEQQRAAWN